MAGQHCRGRAKARHAISQREAELVRGERERERWQQRRNRHLRPAYMKLCLARRFPCRRRAFRLQKTPHFLRSRLWPKCQEEAECQCERNGCWSKLRCLPLVQHASALQQCCNATMVEEWSITLFQIYHRLDSASLLRVKKCRCSTALFAYCTVLAEFPRRAEVD